MTGTVKHTKEICPYCGQTIKERWESLSRGLVKTFISFAKTIKRKGTNDAHLQEDCSFTKNQYNNFQKLKYFGLVAKVKVEDKRKSGRWLLTRKGLGFLKGEAISKQVLVKNNKVQDHSEELVRIQEVSEPYWFKAEDYAKNKKNTI